MAQGTRGSLTLWGQPYGSPLDAWVASPFVALLGPTRLAVRLPYFLLSLALIPLAFLLARRLEPRAGRAGAALAAIPPAYLLAFSALPPPLYPTTLALLGLLLVGTLGERPLGPARAAGLGALGGLACWTHLMSAVVVAGCGIFLLVRERRRPFVLIAAAAGLLIASAPWWLVALRDPRYLEVLGTWHDPAAPPLAHARAVLPVLHRPLQVLLGARTPLVPDSGDEVTLPPWAQALLLGVWTATLGAAAFRLRPRRNVVLLLAVALFVVAVFPFPTRSDATTARFLSPALVPLLALAAAGLTVVAPSRLLSVVAVGAFSLPNLALGARLFQAWEALPGGLAPDCMAIGRALEAGGVRRAYASYNAAYCMTYESEGRVVASQPWNERFPGYPLPFLDQVRFAIHPAWVLWPGFDFDLPSPERFSAQLAEAGGGARRIEVGGAVVYLEFTPPYPPVVRPLGSGEALGDGDLSTGTTEPPRGSATFRLPAPAPLAAVSLASGLGARALPDSFEVEASGDGEHFERVYRRRARRERSKLVWLNGHPQFPFDDRMASIDLGGRTVVALRVTPQGEGTAPWAIAEVLLHPPAPTRWDDWLPPDLEPASWERLLEEDPRPENVSWYYRRLLARRPASE